MRVRAARSRDRDVGHAGGLRTKTHGLAEDVLDFAANERAHIGCHGDRRILRGRDFRRRGVRSGRHPFGVRALAGTHRLQLLIPDVVPVRVAEQRDVDVAEPRIVRAGHGVSRVVEYSHTGRILEYRRAVVRAKLARVEPTGVILTF